MKNLVRKYIREQIEKIFELDGASSMGDAGETTAPSAQSTTSTDSIEDTLKNYDVLKNQQLAQIDFLKEKLKKEKVTQKINMDKIKKLMVTFSQVQDNDLATIPGGKSEDNKVKKMKQTSYNTNKKEIADSIKSIEDQIVQAEKNVQNIELMKSQAQTTSKTAGTPSTPSTPSAP
jgi:hypothetical protein